VAVKRWDLGWLKGNRPLLISELVGIPLVVGWLLYFYFHTRSDFALVLIALLPVFAAVNILGVNIARERQADSAARQDVPTGALVVPPPADSYRPVAPVARWIGAADVPGQLGRMKATTPLAVLELVGPNLSLRVRPQVVSRFFGVRPLRVEPPEVEAIFPAKGRLRTQAICIRPHGQPPHYFLLGDRASILAAIAAAGFPVEWAERAYSPS
jgi:hypothetical protein